MDCSLPSSSVHGIFQARVLEWGAIAFSSGVLYFGVILWLISGDSSSAETNLFLVLGFEGILSRISLFKGIK